MAENLEGLSFCFTGPLESMRRSDAEALVRSLGGWIPYTVYSKTSFLVTNDTASGSSKNAKARMYGIKIINEREFLQLVGKAA